MIAQAHLFLEFKGRIAPVLHCIAIRLAVTYSVYIAQLGQQPHSITKQIHHGGSNPKPIYHYRTGSINRLGTEYTEKRAHQRVNQNPVTVAPTLSGNELVVIFSVENFQSTSRTRKVLVQHIVLDLFQIKMPHTMIYKR
jgi:hypothetical protein